jgi:hypothetical protein
MKQLHFVVKVLFINESAIAIKQKQKNQLSNELLMKRSEYFGTAA